METLEKSENSSLQNRDTVSQNFSQMYENVNNETFISFTQIFIFSDNKRNLEEKSKDKDVE
jgi:hypothetical protein